MHCGGIFKPCCSYSKTTCPNMQNTHIENNAPPSFGYLENHRFSTNMKGNWVIMKLTFAFLFCHFVISDQFSGNIKCKVIGSDLLPCVYFCLAFQRPKYQIYITWCPKVSKRERVQKWLKCWLRDRFIAIHHTQVQLLHLELERKKGFHEFGRRT